MTTDLRAVVRAAEVMPVRVKRFEESLDAAEAYEVDADLAELEGRAADARVEARRAGDAYRDAGYAVIPATGHTRENVILTDVAIAMMRAAGRAYERGRSRKKADIAYDLADRWLAFADRARLNFEAAPRLSADSWGRQGRWTRRRR